MLKFATNLKSEMKMKRGFIILPLSGDNLLLAKMPDEFAKYSVFAANERVQGYIEKLANFLAKAERSEYSISNKVKLGELTANQIRKLKTKKGITPKSTDITLNGAQLTHFRRATKETLGIMLSIDDISNYQMLSPKARYILTLNTKIYNFSFKVATKSIIIWRLR